MANHHYISLDALRDDSDLYLNCLLRLVKPEEYKSLTNPQGVILNKPKLQRQTADTLDYSYGMQALDSDCMYRFGGYHSRTFTFINHNSNIPLQIFEHELPNAHFCIIKQD